MIVAAGAAAQSPDSLPLSLNDAVRRAMQRNEAIGISRSEVRGATADKQALRSVFKPQLSSASNLQRTIRSPFSGLEDLSSSGDLDPRLGGALNSLLARKNSYSGGLTASQLLFNREATAGVRAAAAAEEAQESMLRERELEVSLDVLQAYYGAVLAERVAEITAAALEEANEQLRHVQKTHAAGNASEMDVLNVEVQRDNLEPQRIDALNKRDQALATLKRLIDIDPGQAVRLSDELQPDRFTPVPMEELDRLSAGALSRRPQLVAAERTIAARRLQEAGVRASALPSLALSTTFAKQGAWVNGTPDGGELRDNWTVSLGIQAPLFDGGRRRADVSAAHEKAVQSQLQLAQLRKSVSLDVTLQRSELDRAAAAITARSHTADLAARTHYLMELAFRKGLVNTLQLSDARLQLRQARVNEVQALHDYHVALARLQRASGWSPAPDAR